jgi:hypothetical protein
MNKIQYLIKLESVILFYKTPFSLFAFAILNLFLYLPLMFLMKILLPSELIQSLLPDPCEERPHLSAGR